LERVFFKGQKDASDVFSYCSGKFQREETEKEAIEYVYRHECNSTAREKLFGLLAFSSKEDVMA